jgi:hypothetical protein
VDAPDHNVYDFATFLQKLENKRRYYNDLPDARPSRPTPVTNHPAPARIPAVTTTVRTTAPAAGDPMDLSYARRPQGRKERNECFRCGASDHKVAQCPRPAPARPAQLREGRVPSFSRSPSPRSRRSRRSPSPASSSRSSVKGGALI